MQARTAIAGCQPVAAERNAGTTDAASTSVAAVAPHVSQSFDRWTELPDDVTVQVMHWLMLASGAVPLVLASQRFLQAGQVFRAGPWYEGAKSVLMHARCVDWTRAYLSGFANEQRLFFPKDAHHLSAGLAKLGEAPEDHRRSIVINGKPTGTDWGGDWLDGFRRYPGASLVLTTGKRQQAEGAIIEIAQALPQRVCLRLDFFLAMGVSVSPVGGIGHLISRLAQTGRALAFDMEWGMDLSADPVELGAVLDVACGEGMISFANLGTITQPDSLLHALADRCERFRHLKLVMFNCAALPDRSELATLAAALEHRQAAGLSRITVVIGSMALLGSRASTQLALSTAARAEFERCGLYFNFLDGEPPSHPAVQKVIHSVGQGPVDAWLSRLPAVADESSDSDVIVESSEEDLPSSAPASSADAVALPRGERSRTQAARAARQEAEGPEPRLRKRDRCVIS